VDLPILFSMVAAVWCPMPGLRQLWLLWEGLLVVTPWVQH